MDNNKATRKGLKKMLKRLHVQMYGERSETEKKKKKGKDNGQQEREPDKD